MFDKAEIVNFVVMDEKDKQGLQNEKQQQDDDHVDTCSRPATTETEEVMMLAAMAIKLNLRLRSSDMPPHMQEHALHFTRSFLDHYSSSKTTKTAPPNPSHHLAQALKKVCT